MNLADHLPRTLDEIVRKNRDAVEIRLATVAEIVSLAGQVSAAEIKDAIDKWYPIAITMKGQRWIRVLGHFEGRGETTLSSALVAFDQEVGLAQTLNSVYRLGNRGQGEPDRASLMQLCAILNQMGVGPELGVPEVFF